MSLGLHSWPAPLPAFALGASPRLGCDKKHLGMFKSLARSEN